MQRFLFNDTQYIIQVKDHFEAYHSNGEFICSGDTFKECSDEVLETIKAETVKLCPIVV